ncbi:hypothetical protein BDW74DRAFT_142936 [Aspergillus multicolor]|uniref:uncharacterized protein n=1 Tax=Aspergillus multicolor TaxID=41759 RepID=UPI003CCD10EB
MTQQLPTATQKALSLPELLTPIFERIYIDNDTTVYNPPGDPDDEIYRNYEWTLRSCALVNTTWSPHALRILWRCDNPCYNNDHLGRLECISPERRAFYAEMVEEMTVKTHQAPEDWDIAVPNFGVNGIEFPRLKMLRLKVDFLAPVIPAFRAPSLRELRIDPHTEYYPDMRVEAETMGMVFEKIADLFPNIEILAFEDCAEVRCEDYKHLIDRLHCLKTVDGGGLMVTD